MTRVARLLVTIVKDGPVTLRTKARYVLTIKKDHDGEVRDPHERLVIHRVPKMV